MAPNSGIVGIPFTVSANGYLGKVGHMHQMRRLGRAEGGCSADEQASGRKRVGGRVRKQAIWRRNPT